MSFRLLNIPIVSLRSDSNNDIQSLPSYLITLPNYNVLLWRINLHVQRLIYDLVWITSITILIYYMKYITVEWIGGAALGTYDKSIRFITEGFDRQIGHTIEDGKTYTKD